MDTLLAVAELDPPAPSPERRAVAPLAVVIALLLIAGVVGAVAHDDSLSPAQRLAATPAAMASARSFAMETTTELTIGDVVSKTIMAGEVDTVATVARVRTAAVPDAAPSMTLVISGRDVYLEVPAMNRGLSEGKGWLHVELPGSPSAPDTSGVTDPLSSIQQLARDGTEVKNVGQETVRGEQTTRYEAVLDFSKRVRDAAPSTTPDQAGLFNQLSRVPVSVWLDSAGRVRRQRTEFQIDTPALSAAKSVKVVTTTEIYDFGRAVDATLPDPGNIKDLGQGSMTDLFSALLRPPSP